MLQALLEAHAGAFREFTWWVVPVRFSTTLAQNGKFRSRKLFHFLVVLIRILGIRVAHRPEALYYTPAGPTRLPMLRDIVLLNLVRPFFSKTIFHFHAGGVSGLYEDLPPLQRMLFRRAYYGASVGIKVSEHAPDDPVLLRARRAVVVPNGVPDLGREAQTLMAKEEPTLLYIGVITERKGAVVLVEALAELFNRGLVARLTLVGEIESEAFSRHLRARVSELGLDEAVEFAGVLVGDARRTAYAAADIVCVPSFFESETFGLVAAEAMTFSLPVVASRWRGLVDVVDDGRTGLLVEPRSPQALADAIERLIRNPDQAREMGRRGRQRFEESFTIEQHLKALRDAFRIAFEDDNGHQ